MMTLREIYFAVLFVPQGRKEDCFAVWRFRREESCSGIKISIRVNPMLRISVTFVENFKQARI